MSRVLAALAVGMLLILAGCTAPPVEAPSEAPASEVQWLDAPEAAPAAVRIAAIGAESTLIPLGTSPGGEMLVPDGAMQASWWTDSPRPGETGPAVILGHINMSGQQGVFARLGELEPGDVIAVEQETGAVVHFAVYRVEQYAKDDFAGWSDVALGNTRGAELRVISCGGDLDPVTRHYDDNVVAYATEIP